MRRLLKQIPAERVVLFWLLNLFFLLLPSGIAFSQPAPRRVVSLAPHITEIIFQLGEERRLVGRTDFCRYPPRAQKIPSLGGYLNVNYERLVRLQPDLVLQFPNPETRRKLEALGITAIGVPNETVSDIFSGIRLVGEKLGVPERAEHLQQSLRDSLELFRQQAAAPSKPVALLLVGREPGSLKALYAAGPATYLGELWELCGGQNAFPRVKHRYFSVNKEDLFKRRIDFVLEFSSAPVDTLHEMAVWDRLPDLQAQIRIFTDPVYLIPGPRIARIAKTFAQIVRAFHQKNKRIGK